MIITARSSVLRVTQLQHHRRQIDREAGSPLEEILTRVSDTALASHEAEALQRGGCRPQQYLGRTDPNMTSGISSESNVCVPPTPVMSVVPFFAP